MGYNAAGGGGEGNVFKLQFDWYITRATTLPRGLGYVQGLRVCDKGLLGNVVTDDLVVWN